MKRLIMELKYKIYHWFFMNGFLREVITHYENGGIVKIYAFGFSPRRQYKETK